MWRSLHGGYAISLFEDSGTGSVTANGDKRGHGIGVANVRDRLEARFGSEAAIASGPAPDGYSTQLRMPILLQDSV